MVLEKSNWKENTESSFPFPWCVGIGQSQYIPYSIFVFIIFAPIQLFYSTYFLFTSKLVSQMPIRFTYILRRNQ